MPDTRIVNTPAQLTKLGFKIGQMGLRNWFFDDYDNHRYLALAARWWNVHYTANSFTAGKVNAWHITFEEVDWEYKLTGSRPALHWEYVSRSDTYACKGWKNGRPLSVAATHVQEQEIVEVPITTDALLGELPMGLSYSSEEAYQAATHQTITRTVGTVAQEYLDRITNTYLRRPLRWFGPHIAAPTWEFYRS